MRQRELTLALDKGVGSLAALTACREKETDATVYSIMFGAVGNSRTVWGYLRVSNRKHPKVMRWTNFQV